MRIGGAGPEAAGVALSGAVAAALTIRPDSGRVAVFAATRLVVVDDVKAEAEGSRRPDRQPEAPGRLRAAFLASAQRRSRACRDHLALGLGTESCPPQ